MRVDVWSDFVCPWCFLASISLAKLQESHGVTVDWHSYELRPKGSPPMPEAYRQRIRETFPQMVTMAKNVYGVDIQMGPFGIDSRPALIGDVYARYEGQGGAYHQAVFEAYWLEERDISDLNILADIAVSVGLNREDFLKALADPKFEEAVVAEIMQAHQLEITGVPALLFEEKYFISGAQPYDELVRIVDYIRERETSAGEEQV